MAARSGQAYLLSSGVAAYKGPAAHHFDEDAELLVIGVLLSLDVRQADGLRQAADAAVSQVDVTDALRSSTTSVDHEDALPRHGSGQLSIVQAKHVGWEQVSPPQARRWCSVHYAAFTGLAQPTSASFEVKERTGRSPLRDVSRPPLIHAIVLYPALCSCSAAASDLSAGRRSIAAQLPHHVPPG